MDLYDLNSSKFSFSTQILIVCLEYIHIHIVPHHTCFLNCFPSNMTQRWQMNRTSSGPPSEHVKGSFLETNISARTHIYIYNIYIYMYIYIYVSIPHLWLYRFILIFSNLFIFLWTLWASGIYISENEGERGWCFFLYLGRGCHQILIFTPIPGEMIQFDEHISSDGLKSPPRSYFPTFKKISNDLQHPVNPPFHEGQTAIS